MRFILKYSENFILYGFQKIELFEDSTVALTFKELSYTINNYINIFVG